MPRKPKEAGLEAARLYCQWHIGDRYWADLVLEAYAVQMIEHIDAETH